MEYQQFLDTVLNTVLNTVNKLEGYFGELLNAANLANMTNIFMYLFMGSVIVLSILSILDYRKHKRNKQAKINKAITVEEYRVLQLESTKHKLAAAEKKIHKLSNIANIDETVKIVKFLDDFMMVKFQYYLNTFIIAYFISDKEMDKKEIKKLKEDFYTDISNTLNDVQKDQMLKVFTKQGITLYIHQSFLRLLNDANIKFKNNGTEMDTMNRKTLDAIYN